MSGLHSQIQFKLVCWLAPLLRSLVHRNEDKPAGLPPSFIRRNSEVTGLRLALDTWPVGQAGADRLRKQTLSIL